MNDAPIQIRNPEVVRAIRQLARHTGRPITQVVAEAVNAQMQRVGKVSPQERDRKLRAIREAVARFHDLPVVGPLLTDEDLYDEDGLPR